MGQVGILGEHTVGNFKATGILQLVLSLESIEVTLFLHYFERLDRVNMLLTVGRSVSSHQFESDGIVQTFLVDNVSNGIFLTALDRTLNKLFGLLTGYDFDTIPLFNYLFLPSGNFFGLGVVVGSQQMETLGFLVVELLEVVVELTLHRIVRSNLGDRILDRLDPAFGIALLVACIVERQDLGLKDAIDSSSIQLILMFLILISTFLSQSPTGTFTVTFEPPAVEYGEVDNTVHQSFFTRRTGSFERTGRRIQPDIYTGNKTARELHVVILEEDNLAEELGTT